MTASRVLLLIPPLTQLNTPYPSTAYLTGFLQSHGIACEQADLGIEMVLRLFSRDGLRQVFRLVRQQYESLPVQALAMIENEQAYLDRDAAISTWFGRSLTPDEYRTWRRLTDAAPAAPTGPAAGPDARALAVMISTRSPFFSL